MVSSQPGLIPQVTGALTHARLWAATIFLDHYSNYFYSHLTRGTSSEETLWANLAYEILVATHNTRVCAYRADNVFFVDPQFKEAVQTCGQQISYCEVSSHHQNEIVERRIKKINLVSQTLLLHVTILWTESVSTANVVRTYGHTNTKTVTQYV